MNNRDLIYQIGLTLVKGIGVVTARHVINTLKDASLLFTEKASILEHIPGITRRVISEIHQPEVLQRAEREVAFIEKNKIRALFINDDSYPSRLKDCVDAPIMLYLKGPVDMNRPRTVSIVGTRNATPYGKETTENLVQGLAELDSEIMIVSGLAYGIDIHAHKAALKHRLPTVGVLAHGLDRIYPPAHRNTAVEMLEQGGLLTDFLSETEPDRQNFVKRNRIVAGLADCTIVVESAVKGGALITASIACSYNRDVFAVPGRAVDASSAGCNALVRHKKAALITSAEDIFHEMCWDNPQAKSRPAVQRRLFPDFSPEEQSLATLLEGKDGMHLNTIGLELDLPVSQLAPLLFELEMKGIVRCLPGGVYRLV